MVQWGWMMFKKVKQDGMMLKEVDGGLTRFYKV